MGDVREAPTSERSFLAGETERVFEPSIGPLGTSSITFLEMLPSSDNHLKFLPNFENIENLIIQTLPRSYPDEQRAQK
jgi:hypothetical protein